MNAALRIFGCFTALFVTCAAAQTPPTYPTQPVRVIVPYAAGGPTDVIARVVAQKLSDALGQQFYVENMPGAGGNTGIGKAAKMSADGRVVVVVSTGFIINPLLYPKGVPYDPVKDFAPVTLVAASPNVLTVNPQVPARTVQELIALVKANPGKYSYAQPATGSTPHLNGELLKLAFGLDMAMVPFNGAAPAITSTIGGHTPIAFTALPPALSNIKDGKLRALAVLSEQRVAALAEVPTAGEAGIAGHEGDTLTGMVVPAGTPRSIIASLNSAIKKLVIQPDVKEKLEALGFNPVASTPAEFGERIKTEHAKWAKVIRDAHISIE
jgi:tripartite-type tricarboxylate transporter receptor subunit TctC